MSASFDLVTYSKFFQDLGIKAGRIIGSSDDVIVEFFTHQDGLEGLQFMLDNGYVKKCEAGIIASTLAKAGLPRNLTELFTSITANAERSWLWTFGFKVCDCHKHPFVHGWITSMDRKVCYCRLLTEVFDDLINLVENDIVSTPTAVAVLKLSMDADVCIDLSAVREVVRGMPEEDLLRYVQEQQIASLLKSLRRMSLHRPA